MTDLAYEPHELMVCRIASEMRQEGDFVTILGSFTPLAYASYMLAKLTHAPDAWLVGYNAIGMPPVQLSFTGTEGAAYRGSYARSAFTPNGHLVHLGTHGLLECVSSAQIDGDGAINLTSIGDPDAPKVRLPGGAGSPEVLQNYRKVVAYFSKHDRRTLVERVDFATGRRAPISADARAARGQHQERMAFLVRGIRAGAALDQALQGHQVALGSRSPGVFERLRVDRSGYAGTCDQQPRQKNPATAGKAT